MIHVSAHRKDVAYTHRCRHRLGLFFAPFNNFKIQLLCFFFHSIQQHCTLCFVALLFHSNFVYPNKRCCSPSAIFFFNNITCTQIVFIVSSFDNLLRKQIRKRCGVHFKIFINRILLQNLALTSNSPSQAVFNFRDHSQTSRAISRSKISGR